MSRTNRMQIKPGEVIGRLIDQAKELGSKPVDNISESLSNKSLSHIDEHYAVTKNEEIVGLVQLLKEQEATLSKLSETVLDNDQRIGDVQQILDRQDVLLTDQVEGLKADNRACATELKEIISSSNQVDYGAFEEAFKGTGDSLISQQRAHTVELDRMMMSLKTTLEKNIEKTRVVLEKKIEVSAVQGKGMNKVALIITIVNLLCLIGYIIFDVFF